MLEPALYRVLRAYAWIVERLGKRAPRTTTGCPTVLLTGTFHSTNWINAHLRPMLDSSRFGRVLMVSTSEVSFPPEIELRVPPNWLRRVAGDVGARTLYFAYLAITSRPELLGGFHLLFNGLTAILLAKVVRAQSVYFCVGGPAEVLDGGLMSENKLFGRLAVPSPRIETQLIRAVAQADVVVCMGSRAAAFMRERSGAPLVVVNPGCVELKPQLDVTKRYDLMFLGRLAPIKNLSALLQAISLLRDQGQDVTLAVVGDGELRADLEAEAESLDIAGLVTFAGMQTNTRDWLAASRIFVLSSLSEGLSLSLMEALSSALPAIVPDVGDLADLVKDGYNGRLLADCSPEQIAEAVRALLAEDTYEPMRRAAAQSAEYVSPARAAARWAHTMQHLGWPVCAE